ncbi:unnamed protein product [Brachionus calyciflorus]|uniref:G-protein coupled receptors family 1 profile domain-containing protein n=1 Tax=Brachionus calyciflorus TaxID=104777 RepID=A0A814DN95_9BILA|nr:unnamed protein product [Brachionus calyciflorus]
MNFSSNSINSNVLSNYTVVFDLSTLNLFEWCLLLFSIVVFIVGIIGNLLVVLVVLKNSQMRTITNIFIVNLAIGDFFVILICLPPTIITDITGIWWFGNTMCKIIIYVQYISVCVSVLTLTSISYERYYAIVYPLKFQASKFRAKIIILIIWLLAILINIPHPIVIKMKMEPPNLIYCEPTWEIIYQNIFDSSIFLILYILPMALIFYTYSRVLKVLWRLDKSIAWNENDEKKSDSKRYKYKPVFRTYNFRQNKTNADDISITMASGSSNARSKMKNQLIARRKAAKMLIAVAAMFAVCYLPIHILNILRFTGAKFLEDTLGKYLRIIFQTAHILVYVNSCINPLIYNFMSDNFRKEFSKIIFCKNTKSYYINYSDARQNDLQSKFLHDQHHFDHSVVTKNVSEYDRNLKMYKIAKNSTLFTNFLNGSFKSTNNYKDCLPADSDIPLSKL